MIKALQDFKKKLRKTRLAIMSICAIVLVISIVYWQDLSILFNEALQSEDVSHIVLIPFLVSYLIYRKKELVKASLTLERVSGETKFVSMSHIIGAVFCLTAFLLYWYGSYTFYPLEYHIISLIIFVTGMTLILFNTKTLVALIFPLLFLLFLIPPPSSFTFSAGAALGSFSAHASYALLRILGVPAMLSSEYGPPIIAISSHPESSLEFVVDLPCSGIYSLVAFTMFATFLVYIVRGSITKKIVLFPLGFLMLSILNVLRISLIVFIAYQFSEEMAMTIFHMFSGWLLIFVGILLLLLIAEKLLRLQIYGGISRSASCSKCESPSKDTELFCSNCGRFLKTPRTRFSKKFWTKIAALLLSCYLVTLSIQAPVFAFAQGLVITSPNPEASTDIFPQVAEYQIKFIYRDYNFEEVSRQDASLLYAYIPQNTSDPTVYVLVGVAGSLASLHSWEVCLVTWQTSRGYPPLVTELDSRDIQLVQDPPIIARYFTFQHPSNYNQVTLYWYQKALFKTGITIEPKYTRISLMILARNSNEYHQFEQVLLDIGEQIAIYWEPLKTQSLFSLGVPTMQILLVSTILIAIFLQTTQSTKEWRRKTTTLKIFEKMASPKERLLYKTIKELSQKTKETTTQNIAEAFEDAAGKATKPNEFISMLNNLEKQRIIRADIINVQDQPKLVWKS